MGHGLFLGGIEARAFENYVYAHFFPGKVGGILFGIDLNGLAVYGDAVFAGNNAVGILILALSGIVLQKMSQHFGAGEVVDSYDFITFGIEHLPECKTADTTETIDSNFYICHSK